MQVQMDASMVTGTGYVARDAALRPRIHRMAVVHYTVIHAGRKLEMRQRE